MLHQWSSGSALKTGRRKVPGSIPGRPCWPSRSEFTVVFFRNSLKYGLRSLRKILKKGILLTGPGPTSGQLILILQPTTEQQLKFSIQFSFFIVSDQ